MEMIHDRAAKYLNDVRKNKIKVGKYKDKDKLKQEVKQIPDLSNRCFYCGKIFYTSRFLVKHILRRHSDNVLHLYEICLKQESRISNDTSHLSSFLKEKFEFLERELKIISSALGCKDIGENSIDLCKNLESQENVSKVSDKVNSAENINEINSDKMNDVNEKVNSLEAVVKGMQNDVKELDNLRSNAVLKQDIKEHMNINNEKILKVQELQHMELRQTLMKDLKRVLSEQMYENNNEMSLQISELKHQIQKLDQEISVIKQQIHSPDYVKELEENMKHKLISFLESTKHKGSHAKSKTKSKLSVTKCPTNKDKMPKGEMLDKNTSAFTKQNKEMPHNLASSSATSASYLSKISSAEYKKRLKEINFERERLEQLHGSYYHEFYNAINEDVNRKINPKTTTRKIRFSIATSNVPEGSSPSYNNDFQNKTFPVIHSKTRHSTPSKKHKKISSLESGEFVPKGEVFSFPDDGSGDDTISFSTGHDHLSKPAPLKSFKTSSPIKDASCSEKSENNDYSEKYQLTDTVPSCLNQTFTKESVEDQQISNELSKKYPEVDFDTSSLQSLSSWED